MRRRSERKRSTDVSSPAPASRRTNRRRKSPSISEDEKNAESSSELKNEKHLVKETEYCAGDKERDSSGEGSDTKNSRCSSRMRTPVKDQERSSPNKRRIRRDTSPDKIETITEEENGTVNNSEDEKPNDDDGQLMVKTAVSNKRTVQEEKLQQKVSKNNDEESSKNKNKEESKEKLEKHSSPVKAEVPEKGEHIDRINTDVNDLESRSSGKSDKEETQEEVKLCTRDNSSRSHSNSIETKPQLPTKGRKIDEDNNEPEEGEVIEKADKPDDDNNSRTDARDRILKRHSIQGLNPAKDGTKDKQNSEEVNHTQDGKTNESSNTTAAANTGRHNTTTRKRRWITKKATESNREHILAISTDSLKTLIADVHPVPLSDVQLESSSEVEELASEREEGEQSPSPEPETERRRESIEKIEKSSILLTAKSLNEINRQISNQVVPGVGAVPATIQRTPSPARNQASNVLYITNLVRPFTVLQLKGLLARTGKIVENGFWIDRIKSKCFVEYETEDEAIETRHALHGVRWPASNPKCLNVDFGLKNDMLKAINSTKEDAPKFGQETNKDNMLASSGWSRERNDDDKKSSRPVREWDVGKKENLDRDKANRDVDRRRERSRDRSRDRNISRNRDNERGDREKDRKHRREREVRSNSLSPIRKQKKKEDPPLRLLDDLFRKTKATPCIYWLPLTPEQIAEKETLHQKRLEEQKQRLKQREEEREKDRSRQGDRDRDKVHRRSSNRSSDRRRSRSRDRRRY